jgi:hypothetical protein
VVGNDNVQGWFSIQLLTLDTTDMVPPQAAGAVLFNVRTDRIYFIAIFDAVFKSSLSSLSALCDKYLFGHVFSP